MFKSFGSKRIFIICLLFYCGLLVHQYVTKEPYEAFHFLPVPSGLIVETTSVAYRESRDRLNALVRWLEVYIDEVSKEPATMDQLIKWLIENELFPPQYGLDVEKQSINDAWNNPIELRFTPPSTYTFVSLGKNGKDDGLKGDDLFEEIDILEYLKSEGRINQ